MLTRPVAVDPEPCSHRAFRNVQSWGLLDDCSPGEISLKGTFGKPAEAGVSLATGVCGPRLG